MDSYAITVDKGFGDASRFNVGMIHILDPSLTTYSAGVSHHYGSFGISLSTRYSTNNDIALGFQVFMAMGREPRNGQWITTGGQWQTLVAPQHVYSWMKT